MVPVPKKDTSKDLSLMSIPIMAVDTIRLIPFQKLCKVRLDPSSTRTILKTSIVPEKAKVETLAK